jgi:hypothetical protein
MAYRFPRVRLSMFFPMQSSHKQNPEFLDKSPAETLPIQNNPLLINSITTSLNSNDCTNIPLFE